jgi:hypothetical protein
MKIKNLKKITEEFSNIDKMPMFEVALNNNEYEIYDVYIEDARLCANHLFIEIDPDFTLYENLSNLYEICINDLINKGLY